jgi:hypothetical protein
MGGRQSTQEQNMQLSKDYSVGAGIAAALLNQNLISLLLAKGVLKRDEVFDLLDTTLLSLEQLQSHIAAASQMQEFEGHLKAARFRIEETRIVLNMRHPSNPHPDQNERS